jgi:cytochrome c biogenesis protein CcmG/thiol:disulfide interchange protein DsbE
MTKSWRAGLAALTGMVALAGLGIAAAAPAAKPVVGATVGQPAPAATISTFDKRKIALADLRGKVVVLNFWATWCGPCKREMPMMSAFHHRYQDQGFEIFGVTTEDSLPPYMLKKLAAVLSYPLASRVSGNAYPILNGVPTSYVIDRSGNVRYAKAEAFDEADFAALILPLLREPAPAH